MKNEGADLRQAAHFHTYWDCPKQQSGTSPKIIDVFILSKFLLNISSYSLTDKHMPVKKITSMMKAIKGEIRSRISKHM